MNFSIKQEKYFKTKPLSDNVDQEIFPGEHVQSRKDIIKYIKTYSQVVS